MNSFRRRYRLIFLLALIPCITVLFAARSEAMPSAPTLTVNVTFDDVARTPYDDGLCDIPIYNGACTLRAAIIKANHYPGGGVTINIPAGTYTLTIAPTGLDDEMSGDLNITNTVSINGAGADSTFIDAHAIDRVLSVGVGAVVSISNVTIRNGVASDLGGGIRNSGVLTLNHSIIRENQSLNGSAGGGIYLDQHASATLNNTIVSDNHTNGNGAGLFADYYTSATLNNSVVSGNQTTEGSYGGGISNDGEMTLNNSLVSNNQTTLINGGLPTSGKGGGIVNFAGTLTVTNSTVSNNGANSDGGGIMNYATVNMDFATIAGNLADNNAAGFGTGGGIYNYPGSTVNLNSTVLGQNFAGNVADDCNGAMGERGYTLIEHVPVTCTLSLSGPSNLAAAPTLLDGLKDNGGPSQTRALFAGSPLLDVIPALNCDGPAGVPLTVDQRGFARPVGGACDVGAYEGSVGLGLIGVNLIRNGDAEGSAASPGGERVGMPYWSIPTAVVAYGSSGGFPTATGPGPANRGHNFFAGGISTNLSTTQVRDVTALSAAIDAGQIHYDLSGYFGGFDVQNDEADLIAYFFTSADGTGSPLGNSTKIGDVSAANRGNQTGLLPRSTTGTLPVGTRSIKVYLAMTRLDVNYYNDGYADNLSLVLFGSHLYLPLIVR